LIFLTRKGKPATPFIYENDFTDNSLAGIVPEITGNNARK